MGRRLKSLWSPFPSFNVAFALVRRQLQKGDVTPPSMMVYWSVRRIEVSVNVVLKTPSTLRTSEPQCSWTPAGIRQLPSRRLRRLPLSNIHIRIAITQNPKPGVTKRHSAFRRLPPFKVFPRGSHSRRIPCGLLHVQDRKSHPNKVRFHRSTLCRFIFLRSATGACVGGYKFERRYKCAIARGTR